jgi:eukaryotic-like serine/threonine-protein kinase
VTLSVSRGPSTAAVPDVTTLDVTTARATLENAGFRVREVLEDTQDPAFDGVVISQDPVGGSQAEQRSIVTLFVGRFTGGDTTETETVPTQP